MDEPEANDATKTCPMCGKPIRVAARVCRFCGEPQYDASSGEGVWRDGSLVVARKNAELPYRCIKSNTPASAWLERTVYWHHPALYLLIFLGPGYLILAGFFQHRAHLRLPLSQAWTGRRLKRILSCWLGAFIAMGLFAAGAMLSRQDASEGKILMTLAVILTLGSVISGMLLAALVSCVKMSHDYVWLRGAHPDYLATLPEWLGERHAVHP